MANENINEESVIILDENENDPSNNQPETDPAKPEKKKDEEENKVDNLLDDPENPPAGEDKEEPETESETDDESDDSNEDDKPKNLFAPDKDEPAKDLDKNLEGELLDQKEGNTEKSDPVSVKNLRKRVSNMANRHQKLLNAVNDAEQKQFQADNEFLTNLYTLELERFKQERGDEATHSEVEKFAKELKQKYQEAYKAKAEKYPSPLQSILADEDIKKGLQSEKDFLTNQQQSYASELKELGSTLNNLASKKTVVGKIVHRTGELTTLDKDRNEFFANWSAHNPEVFKAINAFSDDNQKVYASFALTNLMMQGSEKEVEKFITMPDVDKGFYLGQKASVVANNVAKATKKPSTKKAVKLDTKENKASVKVQKPVDEKESTSEQDRHIVEL